MDSNKRFKRFKRAKNFSRRIKRFLKRPKLMKLNKKILQLQKYSLIYSVANSRDTVTSDDGIVEIFRMCVAVAWDIFVKLGHLFIKFFKKSGRFLVKHLMTHPWFAAYVVFSSCALLILHRIAQRFGKKLNWFHIGGIILLSLVIIGAFALLIQMEAFKTIAEWLKSILLTILVDLQNLTSFLDKNFGDLGPNRPTNDLEPVHGLEPKPSKAGDFKTFILFSLLTVITTRFLLIRFKRQLVGESPLIDIVIEILENDISDLPDFLRVN